MNNLFQGTIVEESLEDNRVLNDLKIVDFRISKDEDPANRWHLYKVEVSREDIGKLSKYTKEGPWYMHFWNEGKNIIVVFKNKMFEFNYDDKTSWQPAVEYGLSIGIPKEQLDFIVE